MLLSHSEHAEGLTKHRMLFSEDLWKVKCASPLHWIPENGQNVGPLTLRQKFPELTHLSHSIALYVITGIDCGLAATYKIIRCLLCHSDFLF